MQKENVYLDESDSTVYEFHFRVIFKNKKRLDILWASHSQDTLTAMGELLDDTMDFKGVMNLHTLKPIAINIFDVQQLILLE